MARVARIQISKDFFEAFLRADFGTQPNTTIESNAPKDLEVLGLSYPKFISGYPHTLEIFVKSESFDDVPECADPPLIEPFLYKMKHDQ